MMLSSWLRSRLLAPERNEWRDRRTSSASTTSVPAPLMTLAGTVSRIPARRPGPIGWASTRSRIKALKASGVDAAKG